MSWPHRQASAVRQGRTPARTPTALALPRHLIKSHPGNSTRTSYCPRGDMENRIKNCQLDLFADRMSAHAYKANQVRLIFAVFAYVFIDGIRVALKNIALANAVPSTIPLKLLKIGGWRACTFICLPERGRGIAPIASIAPSSASTLGFAGRDGACCGAIYHRVFRAHRCIGRNGRNSASALGSRGYLYVSDAATSLGCVSKVVEIGFGASPSGLSFAAVRPRGQGFRRRLADRGFPIHRLCASGFGRKRGAPRGASALFRDTAARSVF